MTIKILVVDDEPDLEMLITQKFRKKIASKEFEFIFTRNGLEALKKFEEHKDLEIILTDINMPEMDGLALLSQLSKVDRLHKAVVISAYGDMSNIRSAMNKGAADFVTKPIDFQDLELTIEKLIKQCHYLKEALIAKNRLLDIEKELDIAKKIQEAMIPKKFDLLQNSSHSEILGTVYPAKIIGGDFFDFFALDENKTGIIIGDVSGKSISASLYMAITKTLFRSIAINCTSTEEALNKVNAVLCVENPSCMFVTSFYGIIDAKTATLTYSNAGHTPPYILSSDNSFKKIEQGHSIPLGLDPTLMIKPFPGYSQNTIKLKDQDCLFLYTDGVTEAMNSRHELYSEKRLESVLNNHGGKSLEQIIDSVIHDIKSFTDGIEPSDDIAILCLKYHQKPIQKPSISKYLDPKQNNEAVATQ